MNYCNFSAQADNYAHWLGIEQARECAIETLQAQRLRMGNLYMKALGKRHCRHGLKPMVEQKSYLNGYSNQYARENQLIELPF